MSSPEIQFDRAPLLSPSDAMHLGRLAALGFALPTDRVNRLGTRPVTEADLTTQVFQDQVERLKYAAYGIANIPDTNFGGVALSQLQRDPRLDTPYDFVVVKNVPDFAGEPDIETRYKKDQTLPFRVLGNLSFRPGPETAHVLLGCFSQANISTMPEYATTVHDVRGLSLQDGIVTAENVDGFAANSIQHETAHNRGELSGDKPGTGRIIVERNPKSIISLANYRRRDGTPEAFTDWPERISDTYWNAIFGKSGQESPGYDLLSEPLLVEAFEQGLAEQRARMSS